MDKNVVWKWLIVVAALAGSMALVSPPSEKIRYGLDLKGGVSFTVQIDEVSLRRDLTMRMDQASPEEIEAKVQDVLNDAQERALEVLRNRIDGMGIAEAGIYAEKGNRIVVQLPGISTNKLEEAERSIGSAAFLEFRMVHPDNETLTAALFSAAKVPVGYRIVPIAGQSYYRLDESYTGSRDREFRRELGRFEAPPGYELMMEKEEIQGVTAFRPHFVSRLRELSGDYLQTASEDVNQMTGERIVQLEFNAEGANIFAKVTKDYAPGGDRNPDKNKHRLMAIVLDGTLYSAPRINEAIFGGRAQISGNFSFTEARRLANVLRAGSLPAPVEIIGKTQVDPVLGADSIASGTRAILYGAAGVLLFMLIYYQIAGLISGLSLLLTILLMPLGMVVAAGFLGIFAGDSQGGGAAQLPVLTLPSIAGLLLTIGMAVDANVLIFERIREESGGGKRLWTAIVAGYDRAFSTIFDANVTTLLTGVILFIFGSGPIRGFAVMLCAGILVSMFCALVVTRLLFGLLAKYTKIKQLHMLSIIRDTKFDFLAHRRIAAILSVVVLVGTLGNAFVKGWQNSGHVFGVDMTGGAAMVYNFEERLEVENVRATLDRAGVTGAIIQYQNEIGGDERSHLTIRVGTGTIQGETSAAVVRRVLPEAFPDAGLHLIQEEDVGGQIGKELKWRGIKALLMALLGIVLYLSWRFEFGFALGAIVALLHDVLIMVGLYTLLGRQISLPIIAAVLTVVGYSVNDTIIVFDRIREDLRLVRNKTFAEICNLSINQTMRRTLLTSLTTLITVVILLLIGGGAINDFALALFIGILVGTYSSIFIATPVVLLWYRGRTPDFGKKPVS